MIGHNAIQFSLTIVCEPDETKQKFLAITQGPYTIQVPLEKADIFLRHFKSALKELEQA